MAMLSRAQSRAAEAFGRKLKRAREALGLTQKQTANEAGVSSRTRYCQIELGRRRIKPREIIALEKLFGELLK